MREIVPRFLLERLSEGQAEGSLETAALYVDLAGFTQLADALAVHGPHGAEVVADIVHAAWVPILDAVHSQAGFVSSFAGDALMALFPEEPRAAHALAAADAVVKGVSGEYETPYGTFPVEARVGAGAGETHWTVLRSGTRGTYFFGGTAPARAVEAEAAAARGEIVVHPSLSAPEGPPPAPLPLTAPAEAHPLASLFRHPDVLADAGRGEFRPVTAAFVDVPQDALDPVVADVFALQERHGGHLWPVEIGDKGCVVLLLWGAPVRYEGDDVRALRFLDELRHVQPVVRAGASHGIAFAGFVGTPQREDYVVYGSDVNLAARLMMAGEPGQVLLSPGLAARAHRWFRLGSAGRRTLKGFARPVEAHALGEQVEPADGAPAFVGRASELAALAGFLAGLVHGYAPGAAVVAGAPGIGKSTLLTEARRRLADERVRWLCVAADPVWRGPLQPLRRVAFDLLGQVTHVPREDNEARFDEALGRLGIAEHRPFLGALVDLRWERSAWETAEPEARQRGTRDALVALLRAASRDAPLVLQIDDIHWADLETLAFLPVLLEALADRPFAVIASTRGGAAAGSGILGDVVPALQLALAPLDDDDLASLAAGVLGEPLAPDSVAWLAGRTGGNPFFAEQVLLHLCERSLLEPGSNGLTMAAGAEALPPSVQDVVVARLDDLPADVRAAVRAAAVLGARADVDELARVLRDDDVVRDVDRLAAVAADRGVWARRGRTLEFAHALVRDAAYGTLLVSTRRELHARAAAAVEALHASRLGPHLHRLAGHHAGAGAIGRARAFERQAADRALALGAYHDAGAYAESGLAIAGNADGDADELGLWLALAASRMITHGQAAAVTKEAYDHAAALSGEAADTREGFRALFGLHWFYLFAGEHRRSVDAAQRSLALAERLGEEDLLVEARLMAGTAAFWVGELEEAERHLAGLVEGGRGDRHAEHLASFAQNPRFTALFPVAIGRWLRGDRTGGLRMAEEGLEDAERIGDHASVAMVLQVLGFIHCLDRRPDAARASAARMVEISLANSFPVYAGLGSIQLGWARARLGEPDAGLELMETTLAQMRAAGTGCGGTLMGLLMADAHLAAGRPDRGLAVAEEALADGLARRELAFVPELERVRGELARRASNPTTEKIR